MKSSQMHVINNSDTKYVWLTPALVACMGSYFKTSITKKPTYDIVSPTCTTVTLVTLKLAKTKNHYGI